MTDIDDAVAELGNAGVPLAREKQLGADGNFQAWIEDPDGNRIELMEMHPDCLQYQGIKRLHAEGK